MKVHGPLKDRVKLWSGWAAESSASRLNYCCTTNIFALHVDIIIDQQSVMISNYWSVIINTVQ